MSDTNNDWASRRIFGLEAQLAEARAEVERLRGELEIAWDDTDETARANKAESSLAKARALLRRWDAAFSGATQNGDGYLRPSTHTWLAANPASHPPKADARATPADSAPSTHSTSSGTSESPRVAAERAVPHTHLTDAAAALDAERRAVKP